MEPSIWADPFIVQPRSEHKGTVILLHGRGSSGSEFAEDLSDTISSAGESLLDLLPGYKFIFPTCPPRRSAVFGEHLNQWYDMYSLTHPEVESHLQLDGIHASIEYIRELIKNEAGSLQSNNIILCGISQGFSIAALTALLDTDHLQLLIGFCSWLPFHSTVNQVLHATQYDRNRTEIRSRVAQALASTISVPPPPLSLQNPLRVFLTHCADDATVDVQHGRLLKSALVRLEHDLTWLETSDGGHWINQPHAVDALKDFLIANDYLEG